MADVPLRILESDDFAALRALFRRHDFTGGGVCRRTETTDLFEFRSRRHVRAEAALESGLDVLIRLFMDSRAVDGPVLDALLGPRARDLLVRCGLLELHPGADDRWSAPVLLYPTPGPWIASDRSVPPDDGDRDAPASLQRDSVYPALTPSARIFLSLLPDTPADDFLELCAGTGIAALMGAAAGAERVWAVDITARSRAFAEFNARLNGLDQVTALEGDLWDPVQGRTFDVVVAHPPYMPAPEPEFVYRDGGEDGEAVTWAVLGGAPTHLAPGGILQCTCMLSRRGGATAAQRVRTALGEAADDFDLVFVRHDAIDFTRYFRSRLLSEDRSEAGATAALLRRFDALQVEAVHLCTVVLRRHGRDRPGFTRVVARSPATRWHHVAWALEVGAGACDEATFAERILESPVQLAPEARLDISYRRGRAEEEEPWVATGGVIRIDTPFPSSVELGMSDAAILAELDGSRTLRSHLRALQAEGRLPRAAEVGDVARSFSPLVLAGIVESAAYPLPT